MRSHSADIPKRTLWSDINFLKDKITEHTSWRRIISLGAVGAAAFGLAHSSGEPSVDSQFDKTIETVAVKEGANIRENPIVIEGIDTNRLTQLSEKIIIPVDGVETIRNVNGEWYGLDVSEINKSNPDLGKLVDGDSDGRVWVNDQRASVGRSDFN